MPTDSNYVPTTNPFLWSLLLRATNTKIEGIYTTKPGDICFTGSNGRRTGMCNKRSANHKTALQENPAWKPRNSSSRKCELIVLEPTLSCCLSSAATELWNRPTPCFELRKLQEAATSTSQHTRRVVGTVGTWRKLNMGDPAGERAEMGVPAAEGVLTREPHDENSGLIGKMANFLQSEDSSLPH